MGSGYPNAFSRADWFVPCTFSLAWLFRPLARHNGSSRPFTPTRRHPLVPRMPSSLRFLARGQRTPAILWRDGRCLGMAIFVRFPGVAGLLAPSWSHTALQTAAHSIFLQRFQPRCHLGPRWSMVEAWCCCWIPLEPCAMPCPMKRRNWAEGGRPLMRSDAAHCGGAANQHLWTEGMSPFRQHLPPTAAQSGWSDEAVLAEAQRPGRLVPRGPGDAGLVFGPNL